MLIVTGEVEFDAKDVETFKALSEPMMRASNAEDGCHGYAYYQHITRPNVFRVYEIWDDQAALDRHFETPHMAAFQKGLADINIVRFEIQRYERGDVFPLR